MQLDDPSRLNTCCFKRCQITQVNSRWIDHHITRHFKPYIFRDHVPPRESMPGNASSDKDGETFWIYRREEFHHSLDETLLESTNFWEYIRAPSHICSLQRLLGCIAYYRTFKPESAVINPSHFCCGEIKRGIGHLKVRQALNSCE
eukprot:Blabericola_migrator_1__2916@NODE_1839_length_3700_cov_36_800440_g1177_i0_p2_GENE_NODE_1839_length_3700_cov_36_800440_g1177_i0NODE_1839_length_3700_cov_36_800440_g1177_i0_p2_ORF_typecomplete_len146_score3_98_NODE_1839_length_3700_cov_36_800440_g1177_i0436873